MPKKDWMIEKIDDAQLAVLENTLDKSCIVKGCAGSGKSILALIMAKRIQEEKGDDYQVIVYTKSLCRYMNSGREFLKLKNKFLYHWEYVNRLGTPSADYTIVDEIQDFTKEEISQFISSTRKQFYFFGDSAQSIFKDFRKTLPVEEILFEFPEWRPSNRTKTFELYFNYRLPLSVAKIAQRVGEDLPPFVPSNYKSKEKQLPYLLHYNSVDEQIEAIVKIIKDRNFTDVGIFMPDRVSVETISNLFRQNDMDVEKRYSSDGVTVDTLNFNTTLPKIMTYHSAKGLQFETVFIPMIPPTIQHRSALYVAITRTYHYLYMMYSDSMPNLFADLSKGDYLSTTTEMVDDK